MLVRRLLIGGAVLLAVIVASAVTIIQRRNARRAVCYNQESAAAMEFPKIAGIFSGLYEPLYKLATGKTKYRPGFIGDWAARTESLDEALLYRKLWLPRLVRCEMWDARYAVGKARDLLAFIQDAGITRDTRSEIIIDAQTRRQYVADDGVFPEDGELVNVKIPCWFLGESILEKGIIEGGRKDE